MLGPLSVKSRGGAAPFHPQRCPIRLQGVTPMLPRRRFLSTAPIGLAFGGAALLLLAGRGAQAQPSYTVPLEQLQEMVATKFPRSVPVQGLFDLTLQAPRLRLFPHVNRLGAAMVVDAAGGALPPGPPGAVGAGVS